MADKSVSQIVDELIKNVSEQKRVNTEAKDANVPHGSVLRNSSYFDYVGDEKSG